MIPQQFSTKIVKGDQRVGISPNILESSTGSLAMDYTRC